MFDDGRPLLESDLRATITSLTVEVEQLRQDVSNLSIFVHHLVTTLTTGLAPSPYSLSPPPYAYGSHHGSLFIPVLNVTQSNPPVQMTLSLSYRSSSVIMLPPAPTPEPGRTVWDIIRSD